MILETINEYWGLILFVFVAFYKHIIKLWQWVAHNKETKVFSLVNRKHFELYIRPSVSDILPALGKGKESGVDFVLKLKNIYMVQQREQDCSVINLCILYSEINDAVSKLKEISDDVNNNEERYKSDGIPEKRLEEAKEAFKVIDRIFNKIERVYRRFNNI